MTTTSSFVMLNRREAQAAKRRRDLGFLFPLPHTGGVWNEDDAPEPNLVGQAKVMARVRQLGLAKKSTLATLSPVMQNLVMEIFHANEETEGGATFHSFAELFRNVGRQEDLMNGLCVAGFLEPRLVETVAEADAGGEGVVWVEEIDERDREAFMQACLNAESEAAKALRPFPETGLSHSDAYASVPTSPTPIRSIETPAGNGVGLGGMPVF